jgi:RHS repeat-associated protein
MGLMVWQADRVARRASCFFLLAALLWCLPALAIRPDSLETRVGGCDQFASGQTSATASQPVENATGLEGFGYESASGQANWLNRDPIGEAGGINLYSAMGNNPVNMVDPYGLTWVLFDSQAWGQLLSDVFIGGGGPGNANPNSNLALRNATGTGITPLTDENGNIVQPGNVVPGALFSAAGNIAMLPMGEEEGAYKAADEALKALDAAKAAKAASKAKCFKSFSALKRAMPNTPGNVWHHIVEQSQEGRFGAEAIQNADNVMEVSPEVNQALNALYSSIRPDITGSDTQTVRQWLSTQTFNQAQSFGMKAAINVSNGTWP